MKEVLIAGAADSRSSGLFIIIPVCNGSYKNKQVDRSV